MTNFTSRLLIGAAYVIITVLALLGHQLSAGFYIWLIQVLCLNEFYKIVLRDNQMSQRWFPLVIGSFLFGMTYANQNNDVNLGSLVWLILPAVLIFLIVQVFFQKQNFVRDTAGKLMGWIYISLPMAYLLRIGNLNFDYADLTLMPYHGIQILLVFILIWANDTFAYLVGRWLGKNKLAPQISPKKTIEGFLGGVVLTIGAGLILHHFFPFTGRMHFVALSLITAISGTVGDLFESKIKRDLGIKDSGKSLGGHGGFLDRMDSILFAAPACFFYLLHFAF